MRALLKITKTFLYNLYLWIHHAYFILYFFSVSVFFHRYWRLSGQQGKGGDHFLLHSTTSTHSWTLRHLQLRMWDDYHIFLIAPLVFTRLLLDGIYHFIKLPFHWLMMWGFYISFLLQQSWYVEPVDSNLHQLSPLYYKWTDQPSVLVTPISSSMLLDKNIEKKFNVDIEKPDAICSLTFVVEEFSELFLHPLIFSIIHSRSA